MPELYACDFTGKLPTPDNPLCDLVLHLRSPSIRLRVLRSVVTPLLDARQNVMPVDVYLAPGEAPTNFMVDKADLWAAADNMDEVIANAKPAGGTKPRNRPAVSDAASQTPWGLPPQGNRGQRRAAFRSREPGLGQRAAGGCRLQAR